MQQLSALILKWWGFRLVGHTGEFPKKCVIIVVPHTSNWDFPLGLLVRSAIGLRSQYVGKKSLFKPPFGFIFRWLGGYPVDRSKRTNLTSAVIDIFNQQDEFRLTIAPEGTRKPVKELKTGFYYIAKGAGVPIMLVKFDWGNKQISINDPFFPTDDVAADMAFIYNYYKGVKGRNPENSFNPEA